MTLRITSKATTPASAPPHAAAPAQPVAKKTTAVASTALPPAAAAPAPSASLLPLPPSSNGYTHDLGVLKIGDKNYRMIASNWPMQTLTNEQKKELFDLFATQFLQTNVDERELEIHLNPKGPELVAKDTKEPLLKLDCPAILELASTLEKSATISIEKLREFTAPGTVTDTPPVLQWKENNCAWTSLLSAYFSMPEILEALRARGADQTDHPLNRLYELIKDPQTLDKTNPDDLKQALVEALTALITAIEAQSSQNAEISKIRALLTRLTSNQFLDPQEIWSYLLSFLRSSQDALAGNGVSIGFTADSSTSSESILKEVDQNTSTKSPEYIDLELFYNTLDAKVTLPLILQSQQKDSYVLKSIILTRPGHVISIVRKKDSKGMLRNFVCNSHPNGSTVREISNLELQELLKTGKLPGGDLQDQGYKPVMAFYAKPEAKQPQIKKTEPTTPPPPYSSAPATPRTADREEAHRSIWGRVTDSLLSRLLPLPPE